MSAPKWLLLDTVLVIPVEPRIDASMIHIAKFISSPYSARLLFAPFPGEPAALRVNISESNNSSWPEHKVPVKKQKCTSKVV
ncbi:hypothetical protein POSPLADRAFT_1044062 [Postia placenta MAD-698-R-SB12]|uniref:Uncharacterized protein n=1 Tax=Postia placenta MAD-698-R-SB12 TaxID=670580 RepID=A0A1X6NDJ7_9APHY|nr:hypothetical protein POSPLADRAFT_1044062 [Postia placenta MAD-698-R-SB12]OSX66698.1 hypothetical protein POSPLADRAFT_1044062 [Postia placenta MAD-698-R-SB12]